MAYAQPQAWYINAGNGSTTGYYAITQFSTSTTYVAGQLVRQLTAPAIGSERVYVTIGGGIVGTEPTWVLTKGSITGGIFQECTGEPGVNGDLTNCLQWTVSSTPPLGRVIYDPTTASLQICSISAAGSATKPSFSATAGVTRTDGSAQWCSLGLASNFGAFAAPHARTLNALANTWGAVGNDFYLADNSAEVTSAITALNLGTLTSPIRFFSVDHTQPLPATPSTLKPGASITCSAASTNALGLCTTANLAQYWYGVTFNATGSVATNPTVSIGVSGNLYLRLEACTFQLGSGSNAAGCISIGGGSNGGAWIDLVNCVFNLSNAGQNVAWGGAQITWRNTPDPVFTNVIPTNAFRFWQGNPGTFLFEGIDFTSLGANTMFGLVQTGGVVTVKNCKMHSGAVTGNLQTLAQGNTQIDIVASDSGSAESRNERYNQNGTLLTSAQVVRTGGATDGTTPVSHAYTQSAFARTYKPFNGIPLVIWNDVIGASRTLTVYGIAVGGSATVFNNQVWIDVEYMGDASTPNASRVSTGVATDLSAQASYSGDASPWDSALPLRQNSHVYSVGNALAVASNPGRVFLIFTGGTSAGSEPGGYASATDGSGAFPDGSAVAYAMTRFKMSVSFTAQQKGYVTVYPKAGNFNLANPFYLDPLVVLS
jgi:hypothetical protein